MAQAFPKYSRHLRAALHHSGWHHHVASASSAFQERGTPLTISQFMSLPGKVVEGDCGGGQSGQADHPTTQPVKDKGSEGLSEGEELE